MFSTAVFDNQKIIPWALFLLFSLRISLITRERETEREREIKVTSKRLEEGQVQKIKKDFEMTQMPESIYLINDKGQYIINGAMGI